MTKRQKYKCPECKNEQESKCYCMSCFGTVLVAIDQIVPENGAKLRSKGLCFVSLGEMDNDGGLWVSAPERHPERLCKIFEWRVIE